MTETRAELLERGWHTSFAMTADQDIVAVMRCKHYACGGRLWLDTWSKIDGLPRYTKQFTVCYTCGHRKEF